MKHEGTVTVWIECRNFGFITPKTGTQRVFLHRSRIESGTPVIGAKAVYEISPVREGMNPSAISVVLTEGGAL
jgi:cold shock CspA family protein